MRCLALAVLAGATLWAACTQAAEPTFSADAVRADLKRVLASIEELHPDPGFTMDHKAVAAMAADIEAGLTSPMTRREAWRALARLNPLLGDGHMLVAFPDRMAALQAHIQAGGRLLPIDVRIDAEGRLVLTKPAAGRPVGTQVTDIDGKPASALAGAILARTHGDSPAHARALAGDRFALFHWLMFNGGPEYHIGFAPGDSVTLPGRDSIPTAINPEPAFADTVSDAILPGNIGYLRVDSFDGAGLEAFRAYTTDLFTRFRAASVQDLIIDLRFNPGGDDKLWTEGLAPYFATKPYRIYSQAAVKLHKSIAKPDEAVGSVKVIEGKRYYQPAPDNPAHIPGRAWILAGTRSYSSAILMLTAMQDQGVATIAGQPTGGRSCSSGRVRRVALEGAGLAAFVPDVLFTRPSDQGCTQPVIPDLTVAEDEADPMAAVTALAGMIRQRR
ncbi:S41 family peptidase [Niveispirillum sp. KHB5.9]|uniref:S41 family peptidase n=1 Tax=Niveispirillum sp. KHB5.9 TaxID=3400269 RepID=UPI003A89A263